jgi:hypothetical protein
LPKIRSSDDPVLVDHFDVDGLLNSPDDIRLRLLESVLDGHPQVFLLCNRDPRRVLAEQDAALGDARLPSAVASAAANRWKKAWARFEARRLVGCLPNPHASCEEKARMAARIHDSCTVAQQAMMYQLAATGWANPNNREAAGDLYSRGWLMLAPYPVFVDELGTIKPYLCGMVSPEEIRAWERQGSSSAVLNGVFWCLFLIFVGFLIFVFRDYLQSWLGLLGGSATALLTLWKLFADARNRPIASVVKVGDAQV